MTIAGGPEQLEVADKWPRPYYWLTCAAAGAAIWFFFNGGWGLPSGPDGALGGWLLSLLVSAGAAVIGCILAMFQKTRLAGIALLAAGLGALAAGLFIFA